MCIILCSIHSWWTEEPHIIELNKSWSVEQNYIKIEIAMEESTESQSKSPLPKCKTFEILLRNFAVLGIDSQKKSKNKIEDGDLFWKHHLVKRWFNWFTRVPFKSNTINGPQASLMMMLDSGSSRIEWQACSSWIN